MVCTALDDCHAIGSCDPVSGACSTPLVQDNTGCNDGNACTQTDTCQSGVCQGGDPVTCTPLDACHVAGTCDSGSGQCSEPSAPDGTTCSDGNACSQTDTCQTGVCQGANPVVCTAADTCHTAGICDPATAICTTPTKSDGTVCGTSSNGQCKAGTCAQTSFTISVNGQSTNYFYFTAVLAPAAPTSGSATIERSGTVTTPDDGCNPFLPGAYTGKIALIRRGSCGFYVKASNARDAGAIAVVIYNNTGSAIPSIAVVGTPAITIPVVSISAPDGAAIDAAIASGLTTLQWNAP